MKQKELSILLRAVVILCWCGCALVGALIVPAMAWETAKLNPELAYLKWPCLVFFWCALAVVVAALAYAYRIFADIGQDKSFTRKTPGGCGSSATWPWATPWRGSSAPWRWRPSRPCTPCFSL